MLIAESGRVHLHGVVTRDVVHVTVETAYSDHVGPESI